MISNQILQNTIEGLKGISRIDFCVLDTEGKALATTFDDTWNYEGAVLSFDRITGRQSGDSGLPVLQNF